MQSGNIDYAIPSPPLADPSSDSQSQSHPGPAGFILRKSQPCRHFQNGNCFKGSKCPFQHFPEDMKAIPVSTSTLKTVMCMHWQKGDCYRGDNCTYAHGHEELKSRSQAEACYKTRNCTYFQEKGTCPKGITCTFAHGEKDLRLPSEIQVPLPVKRSGFHTTKLCEYYPKTDCQNGDDCPFAHGLHELKVQCVREFDPVAFDLQNQGQKYLRVKEKDSMIRKPHPEDLGGWVHVQVEREVIRNGLVSLRSESGWVPEWTLPADPACEGVTGDDVVKELEEFIDAQGGSEGEITEGQLRMFTRQSRGPRLFMAGNPVAFCKDCATLTVGRKKDESGTFIWKKDNAKASRQAPTEGLDAHAEKGDDKSALSGRMGSQDSTSKPRTVSIDRESISKLPGPLLWELYNLAHEEITLRHRPS